MGVNAAGSLSAGWGFHCWTTNINNETVWVRYSAAGANAMVSDGSIVTNAVFDRGVSAMFSSTISDYDKADILAFHVPAISSPAGKVPIRDSHLKKDFNLNMPPHNERTTGDVLNHRDIQRVSLCRGSILILRIWLTTMSIPHLQTSLKKEK